MPMHRTDLTGTICDARHHMVIVKYFLSAEGFV